MILQTVKTVADTGMSNVEFITVDKQIVEVVFGKLRIRKGESYQKSLDVFIERPFDKAEKFRLTAKIKGFPDAVSYHDTKYEADNAGVNLEDVGAEISVERVDVLIDDGGAIVRETDETPAKSDSDLPF